MSLPFHIEARGARVEITENESAACLSRSLNLDLDWLLIFLHPEFLPALKKASREAIAYRLKSTEEELAKLTDQTQCLDKARVELIQLESRLRKESPR